MARWKGPKLVRKSVINQPADIWFYTTEKTVEFYVRPTTEDGKPLLRRTVSFRIRRESLMRSK